MKIGRAMIAPLSAALLFLEARSRAIAGTPTKPPILQAFELQWL